MDRWIAASARVGADVEMGYGVVVEDDVELGEGCRIGHHVVIRRGSKIGAQVRIDDHAVIGKQPMRAANSAVTKDTVQPPPVMGKLCIVGTGAVIYAGTTLGDAVLVADYATVREQVTVGERTIIGRGASVENQCTVGSFCKIETNVYITAYSTLSDRVFVAPGVVTSNDNFVGRTKERFKFFKGITVEKGGRVGANVTVLPGKVIGADALVAAGSVVSKDAPARKISMGSPAKVLRDVPENQLLENQGW